MGDCIACETTRAAGVKTCQVPVQPPWAQRAPFLSAATYRTADSVKLKALMLRGAAQSCGIPRSGPASSCIRQDRQW